MVGNWHREEVQGKITVLFHKRNSTYDWIKLSFFLFYRWCSHCSGKGAQRMEDHVPGTKYYLNIKTL